LLQNILDPGSANLVFLGGSMVRGQECEELGMIDVPCAYPARVGKLLDYVFLNNSNNNNPFDIMRKNQISVMNLAKRASPLSGILPTIKIMLEKLIIPPTALFVDFSVNDAFYDFKDMTLTNEVFVRFMRESYPETEVFFIESYCRPRAEKTYLVHRNISRHYGYPLISYRSAVGVENCKVPAIWGFQEKITKHPPYFIHRNIAYSIVQAIFLMIDKEYTSNYMQSSPLPAPISSTDNLDKYRLCSPLSFYDADTLFPSINQTGVHYISGDWKLMEDRKGKPGWISMEKNSTIEFDIKLGGNPRLMFGFLKGYEKLGSVELSFDGQTNKHTKSGIYHKFTIQGIDPTYTTTQTFLELISLKYKIKGSDSYEIYQGLIRVRIKNLSNEKFKINYILSC